ncbi:alpha/beta hydrolase family protein [Paraburkholderia youngii]|uniref:Pimeloyl-ACP methyl ester carboxylesterase n=1 Tax=Paraburkholderia youngii TaxID=2782701 RepID=A0A7W8LG95_9BURK|nr:alpha/beta hydrolase [Paraburkholderia youngii]MBB5406058.1 pimeloyl-ACP methyl ester carboxylesterase [Paraburkholderia youngii]
MNHPEAKETEFRLYPGEEFVQIGRHKFLTYYRPPRHSHLPLFLFVPGAGHLGRISYGHPEGKPSDFLAYWLDILGYGMLAVSYPGDDENGSNSADLTNTEWGEITAAATERVVEAHALQRRVIACGWSMGGRIARSLNTALSARSLQIEVFISLAATPPIPGLYPFDPELVDIRASGFLDFCAPLKNGRKTYADRFVDDMEGQDALERRVIIPASIYRSEYLTEVPLSIRGDSIRFSNGRLYESIADAAADMGTFDFADWPIVGAIIPTSPRDAVHVLTDKARWTFSNTQKIFADWLKPLFDLSDGRLNTMPAQDWQRLCDIVLGVGDALTEHVPGNHFFFVGKSGAQQTAQAISRLAQATSRLRNEIRTFLQPANI